MRSIVIRIYLKQTHQNRIFDVRISYIHIQSIQVFVSFIFWARFALSVELLRAFEIFFLHRKKSMLTSTRDLLSYIKTDIYEEQG